MGEEMPAAIYARMSIILILVALIGCGSTGVVPTGENQYMVSETDIGDTWSSGDKVLAKLYREANDFCAERDMVVETVSEDSAPRAHVRQECECDPTFSV